MLLNKIIKSYVRNDVAFVYIYDKKGIPSTIVEGNGSNKGKDTDINKALIISLIFQSEICGFSKQL